MHIFCMALGLWCAPPQWAWCPSEPTQCESPIDGKSFADKQACERYAANHTAFAVAVGSLNCRPVR